MKKKILSTFMCLAVLTAISACSSDATAESIQITFDPAVVTQREDIEAFYTVTTLPSIEEYESDELLIGSWRYEDTEEQITYRYIFYDDGTGCYTLQQGGQAIVFDFTYTVNEDGTIGILHENVLNIENYTYQVNDGVLTLTDADGESIDYQSEASDIEE